MAEHARSRQDVLLDAVRSQRGQWTTQRARRFYQRKGYRVSFRGTVRRDLHDLVRRGALVQHDEQPGRRYYTPAPTSTKGGPSRG